MLIQAIIFDLDGLLVESEPLWRRAEAKVFGSLGLSLSETELAETTGIRLDEVVRIRYRKQAWSGLSLKEVENAILEELLVLIEREGSALPGVAETLAFFEQRGIPLGLASSSPLRVIEAQLRKIASESFFKVVCSAEFEAFGKPHPGVYLSTAEKLGIEPRLCLAFEDSLPGLIAAKAANMKAVAVPDREFAAHPGFGLADAVLTSLEEWNEGLWQSLLSGERLVAPHKS